MDIWLPYYIYLNVLNLASESAFLKWIDIGGKEVGQKVIKVGDTDATVDLSFSYRGVPDLLRFSVWSTELLTPMSINGNDTLHLMPIKERITLPIYISSIGMYFIYLSPLSVCKLEISYIYLKLCETVLLMTRDSFFEVVIVILIGPYLSALQCNYDLIIMQVTSNYDFATEPWFLWPPKYERCK